MSTRHSHILPLKPRSPRSGLTLIELLISIVVMAVLTTIGLSAISRGGEMSRRAKCGANMRSIGNALLAYAADNEGALPPGLGWDRKIAPMLGGNDDNSVPLSVFHCPEDERLLQEKWPRSYAANATNNNRPTIGVFSRTTSDNSVLLNSLQFPSRTIMIAEMFSGNYAPSRQYGNAYAILDGWLVPRANPLYPHVKRQNYLFCDGHIESLTDQDVIATSSQPSLWARER